MQRVCDFCNGGPVVVILACPSFAVEMLLVDSDPDVPVGHHTADMIGDWTACAACLRLIDANSRLALAHRVFAVNQISSEGALEETIAGMQAGFFERWTGEKRFVQQS